jgi:hypothetical protein
MIEIGTTPSAPRPADPASGMAEVRGGDFLMGRIATTRRSGPRAACGWTAFGSTARR